MGVIPQEVKEAADTAAESVGGRFIKAEEFEGDGVVLRVKGFDKIVSKNPKFGAGDKDALFTQNILEKGETFRYTFETGETNADGFPEQREYESKSLALFIGFKGCDPSEGDWVRISKKGKMEETRYDVKMVDEPEADVKKKN